LIHNKMYRFGLWALEQFKGRLPKWPQYCQHITAIPHLKAAHPAFVEEVEAVFNAQAQPGGDDHREEQIESDIRPGAGRANPPRQGVGAPRSGAGGGLPQTQHSRRAPPPLGFYSRVRLARMQQRASCHGRSICDSLAASVQAWCLHFINGIVLEQRQVAFNVKGLEVIPLGASVNNVFFQLDVRNRTVAVIGVLDITIWANKKCGRPRSVCYLI
jgi:hypothetical protein